MKRTLSIQKYLRSSSEKPLELKKKSSSARQSEIKDLMYSDVHLENTKERKTIFTKATKTKYIGTNLTINA